MFYLSDDAIYYLFQKRTFINIANHIIINKDIILMCWLLLYYYRTVKQRILINLTSFI